MLDDGNPTPTSVQQNALEKKLLALYQELDTMEPEDVTECLRLLRTVHVAYLHGGLGKLPARFASLGASRPWIAYWIVHGLALLDADFAVPDGPNAADIVAFLSACQSPDGGFGGGPVQIAHLAPTYASTCALITLGGETALQAIDRAAMYRFLCSLIIPPQRGGGFCIHQGGEADLRACYLALATAHMLHLDIHALARMSGVVHYIQRCQTYEGGLGGEPDNEAHGGYTFCGLAALYLLGQTDALDLPRLVHWAAQRQCSMEGGFNGRTNKLVDGCYSFWQGGLFALLQRLPEHQLHPPLPGGPATSQAAGGSSGGHSGFIAAGASTPATAPAATSGLRAVRAVPPLPFAAPRPPLDQAREVLEQRQSAAQQIIGAALQAGDRADSALAAGSERSSAGLAAEARALLDQAGTAQADAETAHLAATAAGCAASGMFPVSDPSDPPLPAVRVVGSVALHLGPPLYHYKALQLWLLRCCQQLRGGMKDKPGKPPDYYHTCYCLSGLASAQQVSNFILGPRDNTLHVTDPAVNVAEEKLEAARRYFASRPVHGSARGHSTGVSAGASSQYEGTAGGMSTGQRGSVGTMDVDP